MSEYIEGESPLHRAVLARNHPLVKALKSKGDYINKENNYGFTPLQLAQLLGDDESVKILERTKSRNIQIVNKNNHREIINENAFFSKFNVTYRKYLIFEDYTYLKKIMSSCPWLLKYTFLGAENRQLAVSFQNQLLEGFIPDVSIQWIDDTLGYGLFACRDFSKGSYMGEFTGKVRPVNSSTLERNAYCFHYPTKFFSWNYTVIDALNFGNETRFINHSDSPNLQPISLCEKNNLVHIVFIAKKEIKKEEQLTFDYGKDFWNYRDKVNI